MNGHQDLINWNTDFQAAFQREVDHRHRESEISGKQGLQGTEQTSECKCKS